MTLTHKNVFSERLFEYRSTEKKKLILSHLWAITGDMLVFSAHVLLKSQDAAPEDYYRLIDDINKYLTDKYHIIESTIQILSGRGSEVG